MKNSFNYIIVILGILFFLDIISTYWGVVETQKGYELNKISLFLFEKLGYGSAFTLITIIDFSILFFLYKMVNHKNRYLFLVGSFMGLFFILLWIPVVINNLRIVFE